jgi:autotransporter-associated beta strand protein
LFGTGPSGAGALVNVSGDTTFTSTIALGSTGTGIGVAEGTNATFSGASTGASSGVTTLGLNKLGPGTLTMSGATANTYTGTTIVSNGTMILSKSGVLAIRGPLDIRQLVPSSSPTQVILGQDSQILDSVPVTIETSARLALNGHAEAIGRLTLVGGQIATASATAVGTLTLVGNVFTEASATPASITGRVSLSGGARTFTVNDGGAGIDLDITADVVNGSLLKQGSGTLRLGGANTYGGPTIVTNGTVVLAKSAGVTAIPGPLEIRQDAFQASATLVALNAPSQIRDGAPVTIHESRQLDLNGLSDSIGTLTMIGGTLTTSGSGTLGTLTLGGDLTSQPSSTPATISGRVSLNGATRTFTVADGAAAVDLDVLAEITGGSVTKTGPGALRLAGISTHTGTTTVSAGSLLLDGRLTASPIVVTGGRLGGIGTAAVVTVSGGVLDPGPVGGSGTFTVGSVQLGSAASFAVQVNGLQAAAQDHLVVGGTTTLNNASLQASIGFTPDPGTTLTLIKTNGSGPNGGTFNGLAEGAILTIGGLQYKLSYVGGDGNDVVLVRQVPAPPPPTPSACAPRPNVILKTQPTGSGGLSVTVTAGTQPATPGNRLAELRFQAGTNALLDINGHAGLAGPQTIALASRPTSVTFVVRRAHAGAATTLPFTVVDDCGGFQTFVGGGPNAF